MRALVCSVAMMMGLSCGLASRGEGAVMYASRADWEAASVGAADVDLSGIAELALVNATDLPFGASLAFDTDLQRVQVPDSWSAWSGGFEPDLLYHFTSFSLTASFLPGAFSGGFGFEVEPNLFGVFPITLTLSDGTVLTQDVDGFAGALFFGWTGTGITSFTLSCQDCGFAFGRMVMAPDAATPVVPEPATLTLIGSALVLLGLTLRRPRRHIHRAREDGHLHRPRHTHAIVVS